MKDKKVILILTIAIIVVALVVLGLIFWNKIGQITPTETTPEKETIQEEVQAKVDFSDLSSLNDFESIASSESYKQAKKELKDICYNSNLDKYLECLQSADSIVSEKINTKLTGLADPTPVYQNIYRLDDRFGSALTLVKTKFEDENVDKMVKDINSQIDIEKMVEGVDKLEGKYDNQIYQNQEFQKYLKVTYEERLKTCNSASLAVKDDCETYVALYSNNLIKDFVYGNVTKNADAGDVAKLGETINRSILIKTKDELIEIYNTDVKPYIDTELPLYIAKMKEKYPALNSPVTDYTQIEDFLMDKDDCIFFQIGKYYYYMNYLRIGDKDLPRDEFVADINNYLKTTAESLGMTYDGLIGWVNTKFGGAEGLVKVLDDQAYQISVNHSINYQFIDPNIVNFNLYQLFIEDDYWTEYENNFVIKNIFYNDLKNYRNHTYMMFFLEDQYKRSSVREKMFNSSNTKLSATEMQSLFKLSRYIDHDEINKFLKAVGVK